MIRKRVKLTRVSDVGDDKYSFIGFEDGEPCPTVGERFWVGYDYRTSPVVEILPDNKFRTLNSVYHWEILKD